MHNKLNIDFDYEIEVLKFIADRGFNQEMGARPLYRTIQEHIADMVADDYVEEKIKDGDSVTIRVHEGKAKLVCNINTKDRLTERQKS
jgi:ATP-dependent Clp protease ATP-binding subunit ClpA